MQTNTYSELEGSVLNFVNFTGASLDQRYNAFNEWEKVRFDNEVLPFAKTWNTEHFINKESDDYILNFGTQDYLGLSNNTSLLEAIIESIEKYGFHSNGSPTLTGRTQLTEQLEQKVAAVLHQGQCLLYPSGWMANFGAITGLVNSKDTIVIDKLAHNCLQIGAKCSTNKLYKFEHNNVTHLEQIIKGCREKDNKNGIFVITETLYSMNSDSPDIEKIIDIIDKYDCNLLIDTAHDFGALGERGLGLLEKIDLGQRNNIIITGCFSKALATNGGFVAGPKSIRNQLTYMSPTYVFSTAISKIQCATALKSIDLAFGEIGFQLRQQLSDRIAFARTLLLDKGFVLVGNPSAIIPIFIGSEKIARLMSRELEKKKLLVHLVEYPAVKKAHAIFRFVVNPYHTEEEIVQAIEVLNNGYNKISIG